jgi:GlcNAc-P-P-Und epimerase
MARILITGGSGFIGTHLVELLASSHEVLNLDRAPPKLAGQRPFWRQGDIKEAGFVAAAFAAFGPSHVVHLAARTDLDGTSMEDYADNVLGTRRVLEAVKASPGVERVVVTSTQYVVRPGRLPPDPSYFEPYSVYGESKVETEKLTRAADLPVCWTIVRPTIVWGPWHPTMPAGLWRYIARRWYLHPGREPILRAYAYVGNVVDQVARILTAKRDVVDGQVIYVGERPIDSLEWVNAFSRRLTGRTVRVVPRVLWRRLAQFGDMGRGIGLRFPMTTDRYRRMITHDAVPIEATFERLGAPAYDFEEAVDRTAEWLRGRYAASAGAAHG